MQFQVFNFQDLDNKILYALLQLRAAVFVVEQDCPYQDLDGKDEMAMHLCGFNTQKDLVAYCRILPEGISYTNYCSIGRVVVAPAARNINYGKLLMHEAIAYCQQYYTHNIKISAQEYLLKFYTELGFKVVGQGYLEDNIPHLPMVFG
jgi:ElaA protein